MHGFARLWTKKKTYKRFLFQKEIYWQIKILYTEDPTQQQQSKYRQKGAKSTLQVVPFFIDPTDSEEKTVCFIYTDIAGSIDASQKMCLDEYLKTWKSPWRWFSSEAQNGEVTGLIISKMPFLDQIAPSSWVMPFIKYKAINALRNKN